MRLRQGASILYPTADRISAFEAASAKAMMYAPEEILPKMQLLAEQIEHAKEEELLAMSFEITRALRATVQR